MQDSLSQIKKAEDQAQADIEQIKQSLAREKKEKENELDEQIQKIKEEHRQKMAGLEIAIQLEFEKIKNRLLADHQKQVRQIKQSYENNLERFFEKVAEYLK